ncbi:hypothetical protein BCR34DRAFT_615379 [Clohesyomyces aquaticus]|uniref:Gfd2/YDR514C-like C-terminal domain-containing protein n=1 Tax=Clohesyomyces aquaticus TaxID=1231657 RepID=A0A1Y1ZIM4_9PLEO|nr:hypothetical protein BCR34DRAFT_615379 [Clohesyomyces aquaticus]
MQTFIQHSHCVVGHHDTNDICESSIRGYTEIVVNAKHPTHFRVCEYGHLLNQRYVHHRPDDFQYGKTKWVTQKQAPNVLREVLYRKINPSFPNTKAPNGPIVVLGHKISTTIRNLKENYQFNLREMPHIVAVLDTQSMARTAGKAGTSEISPRKLAWAMGHMEVDCTNAGNNAAQGFQQKVLRFD